VRRSGSNLGPPRRGVPPISGAIVDLADPFLPRAPFPRFSKRWRWAGLLGVVAWPDRRKGIAVMTPAFVPRCAGAATPYPGALMSTAVLSSAFPALRWRCEIFRSLPNLILSPDDAVVARLWPEPRPATNLPEPEQCLGMWDVTLQPNAFNPDQEPVLLVPCGFPRGLADRLDGVTSARCSTISACYRRAGRPYEEATAPVWPSGSC